MRAFVRRAGERFGWRVAAMAALLSACLYAFADLAEDTTSNDAVVGWDTRFNHWLNHESSAPFVRVFELVTRAGGTVVLTLVATSACVVLARRRRFADAALVLVAYAGAELATLVLKRSFERARPPFHDPSLSFAGFSFPSGHASVSAAVYGAIAVVLVRGLESRRAQAAVLAGAATLVLLIGFSRIYLGAHYLSDVLAGLSLGIGWLAVCVLALTVGGARTAPRRPS